MKNRNDRVRDDDVNSCSFLLKRKRCFSSSSL